MSTETTNFGLFKYEDNDNGDLKFLNDTMDKIDTFMQDTKNTQESLLNDIKNNSGNMQYKVLPQNANLDNMIETGFYYTRDITGLPDYSATGPYNGLFIEVFNIDDSSAWQKVIFRHGYTTTHVFTRYLVKNTSSVCVWTDVITGESMKEKTVVVTPNSSKTTVTLDTTTLKRKVYAINSNPSINAAYVIGTAIASNGKDAIVYFNKSVTTSIQISLTYFI